MWQRQLRRHSKRELRVAHRETHSGQPTSVELDADRMRLPRGHLRGLVQRQHQAGADPLGDIRRAVRFLQTL